MFVLNNRQDVPYLRRQFAERGRVRIREFLAEDGADWLREDLLRREDWRLVLNSAEKVLEIDRATRADFSAKRVRQLDEAVYASARSGFQFRYEAIRASDGGDAGSNDLIERFAAWMSQDTPRALFRQILGDDAIAFADGQATRYSTGDFLTGHDDAIVGKDRHAAYVLGLTPVWRIEWGGLLTFHDPDHIGFAGLAPAFNCLDVFRVPAMHSVSFVSPSAAAPRLSITGWLRGGSPS